MTNVNNTTVMNDAEIADSCKNAGVWFYDKLVKPAENLAKRCNKEMRENPASAWFIHSQIMAAKEKATTISERTGKPTMKKADKVAAFENTDAGDLSYMLDHTNNQTRAHFQGSAAMEKAGMTQAQFEWVLANSKAGNFDSAAKSFGKLSDQVLKDHGFGKAQSDAGDTGDQDADQDTGDQPDTLEFTSDQEALKSALIAWRNATGKDAIALMEFLQTDQATEICDIFTDEQAAA